MVFSLRLACKIRSATDPKRRSSPGSESVENRPRIIRDLVLIEKSVASLSVDKWVVHVQRTSNARHTDFARHKASRLFVHTRLSILMRCGNEEGPNFDGDGISPAWFMFDLGERDQLINMPCVLMWLLGESPQYQLLAV